MCRVPLGRHDGRMSRLAPWIKPALSFGLPLLAVVVALPYITGQGYGFPDPGSVLKPWLGAQGMLSRATGGGASGSEKAKVRLYECNGPSGRILSSVPCGAHERVHDIDPNAVSTFHAPPPPPASATPQGSRGSITGVLPGVREDLAAAAASDAARRRAAESDAE